MSTSMNIGGLSSGMQWNDIVDSTIKALEARSVTPITSRITARSEQKDAWTKLQKLVETLNTNARALRRTGFGGFSATVPSSPSTSRTLLSATPTTNATAGRYRVEVLQLADTAKWSGRSFSDVTAARNLTGSFSINGTAISVAATDSLEGIRTKINEANAGVTATIVNEGGTAGRLVLTANSAGATNVTGADITGALTRELGFVDTRSKPISSATIAAAAAMGMAVFPQPAQIRVGDVVVTADLATESIATIAARINAAGGSASVESELYGNETRYRLVVDGNVSAVAGDPFSQNAIDALGFQAGTAGLVRQTMQTGVFTRALGSSEDLATASSPLSSLKVDGVAANLAVGDAINIRGTRGDGTAVNFGLVVQPGDTMQTLLDRLNDATSGFGAGARPATAALGEDGRIRLTDQTGGASRLSLALSITRASGSTASLATATTAVVGRSRELQRGQDAVIRVDGREVVRSSNTITDAINGVNLNLLTAEPGTAIDVTVDRDVKGATDAVKAFRDAYNDVRKFFDEQRVPGAPLYADSTLRRVVDSFTASLRTQVAGNATYGSAVSVGLVLDRNGLLTFSEDTFKTAMTSAPTEVETLFGMTGLGTAFVAATDAATSFGNGAISVQIDTITQTTITLRQREADAQKRLESRRQQLIQQYTRMEEAVSKLKQQSGSLLASMQGLQGNKQ
ncbi:flagellar filament capping protein FliD [Gemmatimonas sp.]|uniref:flagellar filament capping protein FliD n=1 Tax=Gemmatimonas sp. TaxID=1962908 RepID=UPI0025C6EDAC|nr:flagellar filament capping protein FliD [Gemmatimonas sp.]MCA2989660.1 flagellar filament capping protein FliD [Gemmatimonas sp.]